MDYEEYNQKQIIFETLAVCSAVMFSLLLCVLGKVILKTGCSNLAILSMVFFLILNIMAVGTLFIINAWLSSLIKNDEAIPQLPNFIFSILPKLPVVLFTICTSINLYSWTIYFFKIGQLKSQSRSFSMGTQQIMLHKFQKQTRNVGILTFLAVVVNLGYATYHSYIYINDTQLDTFFEFLKIYAIVFMLQGVCFGLGGIMINLRLKRNFGDFYE